MAENKSYVINSDEKGSINISEDVVAVIAAAAAAEVEGVYKPFVSHNKDLANMLGRKPLSRSVKLSIDGDDVTVDINITVEIGYPVNEVGLQVQKAVLSAIEDAAGIKVGAVNVNIGGIALHKEKQG
jgi:uncharacterized alkaline shock family protein YloU